MLDRHAVQATLAAGQRPRQIAQALGISVRTVWRIAKEPAVTSGDDRAARRARRLGRPPVADTVTEQLRTWLTAEPDLPPGEVHRRLDEAGHALGLSTVYRLLGATRPTLPASVQVRFEGVAGEFAQFDFGHVEVRLVDGARRRIHFAAYRLKWSRWMFVTVVPNERAEAEGMAYQTFLELLAAEEIAHRAETRLRRAVRAARFPFVRTIDDFSFTFQASLRRQMLGTYLGLELVTEGRNAIFSGPSGTGKTHLAIAIAYRALQHGYEARFVAADLLIGELSHAVPLGTLDAAIAPYLHPHVLVLDEIGYLSHAADAANVLYRLVNDRYLRGKPILVTTNKPLAAWGQVLHDGDLAEAILDRLLERGVHFEMRGRSYRTRHLKERPDEAPDA